MNERHQPLPPRKSDSKPDQAKVKLPDRISDKKGVPSATSYKFGGEYLYVVRVKMEGTTQVGICHFSHSKIYEEKNFNKIAKEATDITNEKRIQRRRDEMFKQRVPIKDPKKMNDDWFRTDVEFFEAVMCDKWAFTLIKYFSVDATIEKTIKTDV